jgi:hypothetical protein
MTHDSLLNELWTQSLARLGGATQIAALARETRAFLRPREIKSAVDLLRIILAYCLGGMGLRSTSAWAASIGLADLSNVALLGRLQNSTVWMQRLVETLLAANATAAHAAARGRPVRLLDGTLVPKASVKARKSGEFWRIHAVYDLPSERFSHFELTDEKEAEHLERGAVIDGEIRIADRGYMSTERLASVIAQGADVIVRAGWRRAKWLNVDGTKLDLIAALTEAAGIGRIDQPIRLASSGRAPLQLRLVAIRKPPEAREISKRKVRRDAAKAFVAEIGEGTLIAAEWMILVTSLPADAFPAEAIAELYRSRWRIEMAFKRLKSLIGLGGPPGQDKNVAKTWILAHLLMILLLEPHTSAPEVSPRLAA